MKIAWVKVAFIQNRNTIWIVLISLWTGGAEGAIFATHSPRTDESAVLAEKSASIAFCPTSNLFLGQWFI